MKIPNFEDIQFNPKHYNKAYIKKNYNEFYNYVENNFKGRSFSENVYRYFHPEEGKCKICGKDTYYENYKNGFRTYCSYKCEHSDPDFRSKIKNTCEKKYGGLGNASKEIQNKIKQTNLKRYGGIGFGSKLLFNKFNRTCIERYGVQWPSQNANISNKIHNKLKNNLLISNKYLIGYTDTGDWIMKCPHLDACNKCKERVYIIDGQNYRNRILYKCELCTKLFPIGSKEIGISNNSQSYFDQLNKYFPDSIYYKKLGYEYKIGNYSLDCYIPSLHIDIEFNGTLYHMKPTLYKQTDINPINNKMAKEIWDHDRIRKEYIESKGIKVIVVWEDELSNPKELYDKIKNL